MNDISKGVIIGVITASLLGIGGWFVSGLGGVWSTLSSIPELQTQIAKIKNDLDVIGTAKAEVGPDVTAADASGNPNKFIYASCPKGSYVSGVAYKGISQKYCTFCNVGIQVSCTKIK